VLGVAGYFALYGRLFARGSPRPSLRLYLDLLAPISIWGLAMTRVGCFLNGCCWGGVCVDHAQEPRVPWAVTFPFNSPAHERQWMNRQVRVPAELICDDPQLVQVPLLVQRSLLEAPPEEHWPPVREFEAFEEHYAEEKAKGIAGEELKRLDAERARLKKAADEASNKIAPLFAATQYPSRKDPARASTPSELLELAQRFRSVPVHPTQLYDTINAILLSVLLWTIHGHRKRHGVVFGWMLLLYPWSRLPLELIRVDNPHDAGGLTASQAVSLGMFVVGIVWMIVLYRLPQRSPLAVPWVDPYAKPEPEPGPAKAPAPA
jgi:phosphatidylglycerol:prolipoprotein diacylglycerol transferase